MTLIEEPKTLAERIVNAMCDDIHGRSGGDWFFDGLDEDVKQNDLIPELVKRVQEELDR